MEQSLKKATLFLQQYMDYEKYVENAELEALRFWHDQASAILYDLCHYDGTEYMRDTIREIQDSIDSWAEAINFNDNSLHKKVF